MKFWLNDNSFWKKSSKKLKNIPISIDAKIILKNLNIKILLKLNRHLFFNKINNNKPLNQDEIVVAIGIIIKPILLKYEILIIIFKITDISEIKKGVLVSWLAKKKLEKTFIKEKAGSPKAK